MLHSTRVANRLNQGKRERSLVKLSTISDIQSLQWSNGIRYGTALLIGIILVRGGLPLELVALYEMLFFISNLASYFWINGGKKAILSIWEEEWLPSASSFFGRMTLYFTLAGIFTYLLLMLCKPLILHFTSFDDLPYFGWIALLTLFTIPGSLVDYYYLLTRRYACIVRYSIVTNALTLLCVMTPLWAGAALELIIMGLAVLAFLKFAWLIYLVLNPGIRKSSKVHVPEGFVWISLPFIGHAALDGFMDYVDGFIVLRLFKDANDFAIFRYGARELPFSMLLVAGVVAALIPRLRKSREEGLDVLKREHIRLSNWLYPVSIALMLSSPFLFTWVYGEAFSGSATVFNVYLLVLGSRILMPQALLYSHKKGMALFYILLIEIGLNIGLSILLAQLIGLPGIALATVIAYLAGKALMVGYTWRVLHIPFGAYTPVGRYVTLNILLLLAFILSLSY